MSDQRNIQNLNWETAAGAVFRSFEYLKAKFPSNPEIQELCHVRRFMAGDDNKINFIDDLSTSKLLVRIRSQYAECLQGLEDLLEYDIEQDTYNPAGGGIGYVDSALAKEIYNDLHAMRFFETSIAPNQNGPVFKAVHSFLRNRSGSLEFVKQLRSQSVYHYKIEFEYPEDRFPDEVHVNEKLIEVFRHLAARQNKAAAIRFCFNSNSYKDNKGEIKIITSQSMDDLVIRLFAEEAVSSTQVNFLGKVERVDTVSPQNPKDSPKNPLKSQAFKPSPLKLRRRPKQKGAA